VLVDVKDREGKTYTTLGVPIKLSETPGSLRTPPVNFGENTEAVLMDFGYSKEKIKELVDKGVV